MVISSSIGFYCMIAVLVIFSNICLSETGCIIDQQAENMESEAGCPWRLSCTCRTVTFDLTYGSVTGLSVNCSHHSLNQMPRRLPQNTVELLMDRNRLISISSDSLRNCFQLVKLNLSHNHIKKLDEGLFATNSLLKEIDLSENRLNVSRLPSETFDGVENLTVLRIHGNDLNGSLGYNEALFAKLASLRELTLDGINRTCFGKAFSIFTNLTTFEVYGGYEVIWKNTFNGFSKCPRNLRLVMPNTLYRLHDMAFSHLRQLEVLDLSTNRRLGINRINNSWPGLASTKIKDLVLRRVDNAPSTELHPPFYYYLNETSIEKLILSDNNIMVAHPRFSSMLKKLVHIDLSFNKIGRPTDIKALISDFAKLQNLKYLDVSHQSYIDDTISKSTFPSMPVEREIKAQLDNNTWHVQLPPRLEVLKISDITSGRDFHKIYAVDFRGGANLSLFECRNNGLKLIYGPITFTENPQNLTVDLSDNDVIFLDRAAFKNFSMCGGVISQLKLHANRLGDMLHGDINGTTFRYLSRVTSLDLSQNKIAQLPDHLFRDLTSLHNLDLSDNALEDVAFVTSLVNRPQKLILVRNKIKALEDKTTEQLTVGMQNGLTVDLSQNPLTCSCKTISFINWLLAHKANLINFDSYTCDGSFGANVFIKTIQPGDMEFECFKKLLMIVVGSIFSLMLILVAASVCCYRCRWEVRFFFLRLTDRARHYQLLVEEQRRFDYDAFVVYSSDDRDWVNNELVVHVEGHPLDDSAGTIRLCVHERDFPIGEDIIGNIWSRMERSRKTIVVLSKSFTKSNYCNYEVQLARMNSVEQARNLIIPVLLEPLDVKDMSECLSWIVRKLTYIEWPQHESDREEFWQKLRQAIADIDREMLGCNPPSTASN